MLKCDFNKVALQLYLNHTSAWCSPVNLLYIFRIPFLKVIWKSRHRHLGIGIGIGTGIGIGIVKNLFLPYEYFFKKKNKSKHLCLIHVKILSFA